MGNRPRSSNADDKRLQREPELADPAHDRDRGAVRTERPGVIGGHRVSIECGDDLAIAENAAAERIWLGVNGPPQQAIGGGSGVVVGLDDGAELLRSDLVHLDRWKIRTLQRLRQHVDQFREVLAETAYACLDEFTPGIDRDRASQFVEARVDLFERATALSRAAATLPSGTRDRTPRDARRPRPLERAPEARKSGFAVAPGQAPGCRWAGPLGETPRAPLPRPNADR